MNRKNALVVTLGFCLCAGIPEISTGAESAKAEAVEITIDTAQAKEPISPYIYGQFIEHLGRCIYGGIWAEMLEDRKFYFPVTDEFKPYSVESDRDHWGGGNFHVLTGSPWKVIGGEGGVQMVKDESFVGEHTPAIRVSGNDRPAGIEQGELALQQGREYEGYVILAGDAAPVQVSLIWGDGEYNQKTVPIDKITPEFQKYPFRFKSTADTDQGSLRIVSNGQGTFKIGTVSLMPSDHVNGFRADTLQLLKELNSPVYRWPGGNFVSDYNWKDGIGDRDKRPPRKNPAWTGIEPNDVGIHEFMDLCRLLKTEPYIAVNTGLGAVEAAAEEVEYCNGSSDTKMGKWRAENGHPEPFQVKFWAVGNEMYGNWQKGHMPLSKYVEKHKQCVELMRAVDPSIQLIGVGNVGDWSQTMLTECADHMNLLSEHIYQKSKPNLAAHVALIPDDIKRVADAHREYRKTIPGLKEKDIRIAMDEWNYWYGPYIYGELGVQYHLQDALGIAAGLHEYFRNSDIYYMANYAQTVNVIGAIKTSKTAATFDTTGLVLKLYRDQYGEIPLDVQGAPKPLDVAAAWTKDRKAITIGVVNPTEKPADLHLNLKDASLAEQGSMWWVTGPDKMAANVPGKEQNVKIEQKEVSNDQGHISVPALSVALFRYEVK